MKNFMIVIVALQITNFSFSQNYGHYVVLESGDTLIGSIRSRDEIESCNKLRFYNSDQKKVKLNMSEVKSYCRGKNVYVKKATGVVGYPYGYIKLIQEGYLSLYRYTYAAHTGPYDQPSGQTKTIRYYVARGQSFEPIKKHNFRKASESIFWDNKEILSKIKSKEFDYSDLLEIIILYNIGKN